jgi:threonine dehydrogenase-like Zn-dependent dehydrogenase
MKALQFVNSIPRYALTKAVGTVYRRAFWGRAACLRYQDVPEPQLPGEEWVKIRTRYGGICGSDLNLISLHDSPSVSPFASFPFTIGHENVGTVAEVGSAVEGVEVGDRVVVDPLLPCEPRGINPPCPFCQAGAINRCQNFARGRLAPGLLIGSCRDTGGSWSPYFVAHRSQLYHVPGWVSDENALLLEPFCVALHAVLHRFPSNDDTVLVVGAGIIGLCTVAALRALGSLARVLVLAKYPFQGRLAEQFGADQVIYLKGDYYAAIARATGAAVYKPILGKRMLVGGADIVYECVGSARSIDDALRFTRTGGTMTLVGLASVPWRVDWTPIWLHELTLIGSFCYGTEVYEGQRIPTFRLGLELISSGQVDLTSLLTHTFRLEDYETALATALNKGNHHVIKVAFDFGKPGA